MYQGLLHSHSGLRWIALLLLMYAIINALSRQNSGLYEKKDKMINLFAMVVLHVQLLIGLGLYFINSTNKVSYHSGWISEENYRFFGLEHILGMILAIALITLGRKKAEALTGSRNKHRRIITPNIFLCLFTKYRYLPVMHSNH